MPADIRHAVEGKRAGWQRLRRFEQVTDYHTMNTAAAALGHHMQNRNLQIQRMEADLGTQLLIRGNRYQPIAPTPRGQRLLVQLRRPDVRELLDQHAPPGAHQKRGPYKAQDRPSNLTGSAAGSRPRAGRFPATRPCQHSSTRAVTALRVTVPLTVAANDHGQSVHPAQVLSDVQQEPTGVLVEAMGFLDGSGAGDERDQAGDAAHPDFRA